MTTNSGAHDNPDHELERIWNVLDVPVSTEQMVHTIKTRRLRDLLRLNLKAHGSIKFYTLTELELDELEWRANGGTLRDRD